MLRAAVLVGCYSGNLLTSALGVTPMARPPTVFVATNAVGDVARYARVGLDLARGCAERAGSEQLGGREQIEPVHAAYGQ
jgi:hypothetical protein